MDPHGLAILEHVKTGREQWFNWHLEGVAGSPTLLSSSMYLRPSRSHAEVIRRSFDLCTGSVLDVGAGRLRGAGAAGAQP
jgi:hypothetical protein